MYHFYPFSIHFFDVLRKSSTYTYGLKNYAIKVPRGVAIVPYFFAKVSL